MKTVPIVIALLLAASGAAAQGLTLDQASAEALRAEPGLRAARAEADVARGERRQAELRPNPDVSIEQREQAGGMDRQTTIEAMVPLDIFRRAPRIERAGILVDRADALARDRERLLAATVRERYGDALTAARRLEVMTAVVAAAQQTVDVLASRVREGAAPPIDRDVALVELRRLEGERALEAGRGDAARSRLNVILGRAPNAPLTLADSLDRLAATEVPDSAPPGERADVRAAVAEVDAARAETALAAQMAKPEVSLVGGYMRMTSAFPLSGVTAAGSLAPIQMTGHNFTVGVRMSLPVFDRGQGSVAAATAREAAAAATLAERRLAADGELAEARARLAAARAAVAVYAEDTRALARRNVDVVRETYALGRGTLLDVLAEQRRYLDFEAGYIAALADAYNAATDLQRAKGALQ
jgi:cobalt-zinc-cadmium efflux system outer membrane protein